MLKCRTVYAPHSTTPSVHRLQRVGLLCKPVSTRLRSTASILPHHSPLLVELGHSLYLTDFETDLELIPVNELSMRSHALPWRLLQPLNLG